MKLHKLSRAVLLAIPLVSMLAANVTVRLHEPPPGRVSIEQLWWVDIFNSESVTYQPVYLHGEVSERDSGLVYSANSNEFSLPPGRTTKRLRDITLRDQWYKAGYEAFFTRTGTIPAGSYRYSITLMPDLGGDTSEFTVSEPGKPRLLAPLDGARLSEREPRPLFLWAAPAPPQPGVRYELTVVRVLEGQTREEAIRANQPWFRQQRVSATSLRYPTRARRLEAPGRYAWQVRALSGRTPPGESDIRDFAVGESARMLTRDEAIALIQGQVIKPESLNHDLIAFLGSEPLAAFDSVSDAYDTVRFRVMSGPTWFAWLDDDARAGFAHETRYVYVDAYTGQLTTEVREWWPLLNGRPAWYTRRDWEAGRYIFFSNLGKP